MSAVTSWPKYLLRDIPDELRADIQKDARKDKCALIEVMRRILCGHYDLDCEPVPAGVRLVRFEMGTTMILRLQPALWEAIKDDAGSSYGSTRKTILGILAAHYNGGNPHD